MIRQEHLIVVVWAFVIGCAFLLVVGCSGTRSEAPKEKGHTEATNNEQGHSGEAASEEARCEGTRTIVLRLYGRPVDYLTNDVPGCPKGGTLSGTDKRDHLAGEDGEDEVRGLGGLDKLSGGGGSDVIYAGPGDDQELWGGAGDDELYGGPGGDFGLAGDAGDDELHGGSGDDGVLIGGAGEDVIYGGDGNDGLDGSHDGGDRDKLYCGKGKDQYNADKNDYVDSSCEKKTTFEGRAGIA